MPKVFGLDQKQLIANELVSEKNFGFGKKFLDLGFGSRYQNLVSVAH
jgi:hypothetical protein